MAYCDVLVQGGVDYVENCLEGPVQLEIHSILQSHSILAVKRYVGNYSGLYFKPLHFTWTLLFRVHSRNLRA